MTETTVVRLAIWALPVAAAFALAVWRRPDRKLLAGILLGSVWNAWVLLALNAIAVRVGWWSFAGATPTFMDVPLDLWLGWTVLWGIVAPLLMRDRPVAVVGLAFLWGDLIVMPMLAPIVTLHEGWLVGELSAILIGLIPGLLLVDWTSRGTNLYARASLQVLCAGALLLWIVPSVAIDAVAGWSRVLELPSWHLSLVAQLLVVPVALGVRAVMEFAVAGRGTPLPYDPPRRLVVTGPYGYVRNPMQVAMVLIFAIGGVGLLNIWLVAAAVVAFVYGAGLARWHEDVELSARFGGAWPGYRDRVRAWIPRLRPRVAGEATLFVAFSCGTCRSVGRWFESRAPVGLRIAPAEASAEVIRRVTYIPGDGRPERGVAAIGRALEHIHLGWAVVGWLLVLPGIRHLVQIVADVFGPDPGPVGGGSAETWCVPERQSSDRAAPPLVNQEAAH